MEKQEYDQRVETIKAEYEPKIVALMNAMREHLVQNGFRCTDVFDWADEEYNWEFGVFMPGAEGTEISDDETNVDVRFTIHESATYGDDYDGINFGIQVTSVGGAIMGQLTPYNYTDDVWVDVSNAEAVQERFIIMQGLDHASLHQHIQEWAER